MFTLSRSLNISKNELSRYLSSCLNTTFRLWLAEVRFEAAKKMMLDSPTSVMTSFLPSVASLPVPISTVCSKRKKAALLRLGESNYSAPPMGMSNRLTVVLQQELH